MTDNSVLIGNASALTSDVRYTMKPSSVRCRSYRSSIPTNNGSTFAATETAQINVPSRRNCFLDNSNPYWRMTVQNTNTAHAIYVDGTAASFISRIDIFHGSNVLESIQDYGLLFSYLTDFQLNTSQRAGLESTYGTTSNRKGITIAAGGKKTFCIPVMSSIIGCLNEKMLPLGISDSIRVEVTFQSLNKGAVVDTSYDGAWSILNFELVVNILELSDEGMKMVESVSPFTQPIYMHGSSYRHFSSTVSTGSIGQRSLVVPAKYASLKGIIVCPRRASETAGTNEAISHSISSRVNPNIDTYWWRVGSLQVPQKPVTLKNSYTTGGYAEAFISNLQVWNAISSPEFSSSLTYAYFNVANTAVAANGVIAGVTDTTSYQNAFAIATEFENIANRSDIILSGTNTLNNDIFFEYTSDTAVSDAYTIDFFANFDQVLMLDEYGQLSVRF
jgi:hypothetical protein